MAPSWRPALFLAFGTGAGLSPWIVCRPFLGALALLVACFAAWRRSPAWAVPVLVLAVGLAWGNLRLKGQGTDPLQAKVATSAGPVFCWVKGVVSESEPWEEGCRVRLSASSFRLQEEWSPCSCDVRAYLPVAPPQDGSVVEVSLRLTRPAPKTNPGQFDMAAYLARMGIRLTGTSRSEALVKVSPPRGPALLSHYRLRLEERLLADTSKGKGAILALLLGKRGLMGDEETDVLTRSGLFHLVALSGFQVGLLIFLLAGLANACNWRPAVRDSTGLILIAVYGLLVAESPSLDRAILMGVLFLGARLRPDRRAVRLPGARLLRCSWDTSLLTFKTRDSSSPSPRPSGSWPSGEPIPRSCRRKAFGLRFSGCCGWGSRHSWLPCPLSSWTSTVSRFSAGSPRPWRPSPSWRSRPSACRTCWDWPSSRGSTAYSDGSWIGSAKFSCSSPNCWDGTGSATPFCPCRGRDGSPSTSWASGCCAGRAAFAGPGALLAVFAVVASWAEPRPDLRILPPALAILNVGQASCQVLTCDGRTLLVDAGNGAAAGPSSGRSVIEPFLASAGVRSLDGILLTHWDADHAGSAVDLLQDFPVGFLAYPATDPPPLGAPSRAAALASARGARLLPLSRETPSGSGLSSSTSSTLPRRPASPMQTTVPWFVPCGGEVRAFSSRETSSAPARESSRGSAFWNPLTHAWYPTTAPSLRARHSGWIVFGPG